MPKLLNRALNAAQVQRYGPGEHADGNGLALRISTTGSRYWVQRLRVRHRPVNISLGSAACVSLGAARSLAADNRAIAMRGGDPRRARVPSFAEAEARCYTERLDEWRGGANSNTAKNWRSRMAVYVLPTLGDMPISTVGTSAVKDVLRPIALAGKHPLAIAVGGHIALVLRDAHLAEWRDGSTPVEVVIASLPKRRNNERHAPALHYADVGAALAVVDAGSSTRTLQLALRFIVLTAARQIEARRMTWDQVDLDAAVWTRPADGMKNGREHRVPLSAQALAVLRSARKLSRGALVFQGQRGGMVGVTSVGQVLRSAGIPASGHGFRSSFRTWLQGQSDVPHHTAELCISHSGAFTATEQAYARSDLLEQRRPLMQAWADAIS